MTADHIAERCRLCDTPLVIEVAPGRRVEFTGHTAEFCRIGVEIRLRTYEDIHKRDAIELARSERARIEALQVIDWLDQDADRVRELYDAMMASVKVRIATWIREKMNVCSGRYPGATHCPTSHCECVACGAARLRLELTRSEDA